MRIWGAGGDPALSAKNRKGPLVGPFLFFDGEGGLDEEPPFDGATEHSARIFPPASPNKFEPPCGAFFPALSANKKRLPFSHTLCDSRGGVPGTALGDRR